MRIIRRENCVPTPWKNKGGSTQQILIYPETATLDNFMYRISMAIVATDNVFSIFENIDRQLLILEGEGILLSFDHSKEVISLTTQSPLSFLGESTLFHLHSFMVRFWTLML